MSAFLDTNILIKLADPSAEHHGWCLLELEKCQSNGGAAIISDIVYCEFCYGMASKQAVDAVVKAFALDRIRGSDDALFRAAEAFKRYREVSGRPKPCLLPDFLIGAIAESHGLPLVTTNGRDFAKYFPALRRIEP